MPLVKGKLVTPEAALAAGLCPECGDSFKDADPVAHENMHWKAPVPVDKRGDKTRARQAMLAKYIAEKKPATQGPAPLP